MEEIRQRENYELAFHISPDLQDSKIQEVKQAIDQQITSLGGSITFSKDPEKTRLSYPVKNHAASFFSYIQFNLGELENLEKLRSDLRLNKDVIRFLIIKLESDIKREAHLAQRAKIQERQKERKVKKAETKPIEKPAKDEKVMEEQIEDVIEKL